MAVTTQNKDGGANAQHSRLLDLGIDEGEPRVGDEGQGRGQKGDPDAGPAHALGGPRRPVRAEVVVPLLQHLAVNVSGGAEREREQEGRAGGDEGAGDVRDAQHAFEVDQELDDNDEDEHGPVSVRLGQHRVAVALAGADDIELPMGLVPGSHQLAGGAVISGLGGVLVPPPALAQAIHLGGKQYALEARLADGVALEGVLQLPQRPPAGRRYLLGIPLAHARRQPDGLVLQVVGQHQRPSAVLFVVQPVLQLGLERRARKQLQAGVFVERGLC